MTVFSLFTDSRGLVWVGTNGGLFSYDGFELSAPAPASEYKLQIYSLVEHDGKLYAGTNNGVLVYDFATCRLSQPAGEFPMEIRSMLLVSDELWIGSLYGVYKYNLSEGTVVPLSDGLPHRSVYTLVRDRRGVVYAGTYDGLARWNIGTSSFEPVALAGLRRNHGNLFVNAIAEAPDGSLWLGTEGGLLHFDPVADKAVEVPGFGGCNIKSLAPMPDGKLLVGTDAGLMVLGRDGAISVFRHDSRNLHSIADDEIWAVMADPQGNIWTGSEMGLSVASYSEAVATRRLDMLTNTGDGNQMYAACRDSYGDLWLGGLNGLLRLDASGRSTVYAPGKDNTLSHKRVRYITEDASHRLWVATDAGINVFDRDKGVFDTFHVADSTGHFQANWVYGIVDDGADIITGSYLGGIHIISKDAFKRGPGTIMAHKAVNSDNGLANDLVNTVLNDEAGNKWILLFRDSALTRIDGRSGTFSRVDVLGATGQYPSALCRDAAGRIWCAFSGGAAAYATDGSLLGVARFPATDTDEGILAMGPVGTDMWISTVSNVWKVTGDGFEAELLGLPNKYYTSIYDDKAMGKVILGAVDELVFVDPELLAKANHGKNIRMLRLADGDSFPGEGDEPLFEVPFGDAFAVSLATLDYTPASAHRFAYKIMKTDSDSIGNWTLLPEKTNQLSLPNMGIGKHRVAVRVAGSGAPLTVFTVRVQPPWYLTKFAMMIYMLLFMALVCVLVVWLRRRARLKMEDVYRQQAIADAERRLTILSDISHDLKTPLSMIIGPVSRLRENIDDAATRHTLDVVYDNALKLNNLIHRTIELNRLDEDSDNMLIVSRFDAVEFCRSIFESYHEGHPDKNFVLHAPDVPIIIDADAVKLESIVNNLLSNACKYSGEHATISGSLAAKDGRLEFIVADDGMGIAAEEQALVFQRMFRSSRTSGLREGTGIGLYLIKKYLELHKGTIELYSHENEGTTFIITLPLPPEASAGAGHEAVVNADSSKPKVLIVEDNTGIAGFLCDTLGKDYNCATAANGRSGLALAASFGPDLIIVDEMMPVMTGLEMVRRLKQNPRLATVPVIMLTAKDDNTTETESVRLGIDIFMPKPFEPAILLGRVAQLLAAKETLRRQMRIEAMTAPKPIELESLSEKQLAQVTKIIEDNISDPELNVNALAEKSGIGTKQLYRLVKKYVGDSPVDYIRRMRLRRAAMLLEQHKFTVSEIMYMVGFKTASYFSKCFQAEYGCKPSEYAKDKEL